MSAAIELYCTEDYVGAGRLRLLPLLKAVFEPIVGESLEGRRFHLSFHGPIDEQPLDGTPTLVNLRASRGYLVVRIFLDDRVIYQHPHTVREIIGEPLQRLLAEKYPDESHWGYGVQGEGLRHVGLVRPAPKPRDEIHLGLEPGRPAGFDLEEVPDREPPTGSLALLGVTGHPGAVRTGVGVVLRPAAYDMLAVRTAFSREVEEGGFLVGRVFRDGSRQGGHLIEIDAVIPAERTGASLLHFTFTGESFLRMSEQLARRNPDELLVGWYHTHLFPAHDTIGLSSIDVDLHRGTFRRPWQVAGLVNLDRNDRTVRFYHATETHMALADYWVAEHAG